MVHITADCSSSKFHFHTFAELAKVLLTAKSAVTNTPQHSKLTQPHLLVLPSNSLKHLSHCVVSTANLYAQLPGA